VTKTICFGKKDEWKCIDLRPVDTSIDEEILRNSLKAPEDPGYNALACALKAESIDGLKAMSCDERRHCSLYQADIDEEGFNSIFTSFSELIPQSVWNNAHLDVNTTLEYGTFYYLLSPDGKLMKVIGRALVSFVGDKEHILSEREEHILQTYKWLAPSIMSSMEDKEELKPAGKEDEGKKLEPTFTDLKAVLPENLFQTPAQDAIVSSDEEIVTAFQRWLSWPHTPFVERCIESNDFYLTTQDYYEGRAKASFDNNQIVIYNPLIESLLQNRPDFEVTMLHECFHSDFYNYGVNDEANSILQNALDMAKCRSLASGFTNKQISAVIERYKETFFDVSPDYLGDEIRAYSCSDPGNKELIRGLLLGMLALFDPDTSFYLLGWLADLIEEDSDIKTLQYASAMSHIETFKLFYSGLLLLNAATDRYPSLIGATVWWYNEFTSTPANHLEKTFRILFEAYYRLSRHLL